MTSQAETLLYPSHAVLCGDHLSYGAVSATHREIMDGLVEAELSSVSEADRATRIADGLAKLRRLEQYNPLAMRQIRDIALNDALED